MAADSEYVTLAELCERIGGAIPLTGLYQFSRLDRLPGQTRIGKRVLVHWPTFRAALDAGGIPSCRGAAAVTA